MVATFVLAAFLLAHAAIHAGFMAPRPPATAGGPAWPFDLSSSWVLRPLGVASPAVRLLGVVFVAATLGAYALAAICILGSCRPVCGR